MSERIITLFGEEIVPEQMKAVGRSRGKKKNDAKQPAADNNADEVAVAPGEEALPSADTAETTEVAAEAGEQRETPVAETEIETNGQAEANGGESERGAKKNNPKAEKNLNLPDDWKGEKHYYTIGEVADLFGVKTSNIRFWTNEFAIKVRTTRKGDRLYTSGQIKEIKTIHHLVKERGFTLAGAKAKLAAPDNIDVKTVDLKQSLLKLRNKLTAIKNQLK